LPTEEEDNSDWIKKDRHCFMLCLSLKIL
jgi:hypothetical protein